MKSNFAACVKSVAKIACFVAVLSALLYLLSAILVNGGGSAYLKYASYKEGEPVDVLLLGNSHAQDALLPKTITADLSEYYEADIHVFNGSITGMRIEQLYYYCADLIQQYKPKLVIIDSYVFCPLADEHREIVTRWTFDELPLSANKVEGINLVIPETERASYYFPVIKHHSRWKSLKKGDFDRVFSVKARTSTGREEENEWVDVCADPGDGYFLQETSKITETVDLTSTEEETLRKLIVLLEEEDIPFAFLSIPYKNQMNLNSIQQIKINNEIKMNYLGENSPFFDMNRIWQEIGFGYSDLRDEGHVNKSGAEKVSTEVINFIEKTYDFINGAFILKSK